MYIDGNISKYDRFKSNHSIWYHWDGKYLRGPDEEIDPCYHKKTVNLRSIVKKNIKKYHKMGLLKEERNSYRYLCWLKKEFKRQKTNKHNRCWSKCNVQW